MSLVQTHTGPGFLGVAADAGRTDEARAHLMLRLSRPDASAVEAALAEIPELTALHHISGDYDLVAVLAAARASTLDALIARISRLDGVRTVAVSRLAPRPDRVGARSFAAA